MKCIILTISGQGPHAVSDAHTLHEVAGTMRETTKLTWEVLCTREHTYLVADYVRDQEEHDTAREVARALYREHRRT